MSHVLLDGEERNTAAVRFLLMKWGVTSGAVPSAGATPTVHDGDAVILADADAAERMIAAGTLPHGPGGAVGPAAPLICITGGRPLPGAPAAWLLLEAIDADGSNLRLALRSSIARARSLRGDPRPEPRPEAPQDSYLHFLGHELRSPLTAIKTALEVLEGEMGGLGPDGVPPRGPLKMLSIALRNVRRLHRTVEWSQDLLARRDLFATPRPRTLALVELTARLQGLGTVLLAPDLAEADIDADPDLLESLVTQAARALGLACPDHPLTIAIASGPESAGLDLLIAAADGATPVPGAVAGRTRLVAAREADTGACEDLERLAGFLVPAELVSAAGAEIAVVDVGGRPALALALASRPVVSHTA
ncbi:hypothetical protein KDM41_01680 [bacterium]|nr:hypothetical protein [bacterium]